MIPLTGAVVPGNRWDLLPPPPDPAPPVGVVVCHYEQHRELERTVAALHAQRPRPASIVVTDDGSAVPPDAARLAGPVPVRVVTQPDRGFRAAAARNRGAAASTGDLLVFLDADTCPAPGFLAALLRRVAVSPDVLAVGRRRHVDLAAGGGDPAGAPLLGDPEWLARGYRDSRDLLDADGRSFRFVISALLACSRTLFDDLGGFDERFVGYGGEDWDLGYRAWNAGAVLVHEPGAVGWHDGPDRAGRDAGRTDGDAARVTKDAETARLARLIPEPLTRGAPLPGAVPDVRVDLGPVPTAAGLVRLAHSLLRQTHRDLRFRLSDDADDDVVALYREVAHPGPWSADQLARARARLRVDRPLPPQAVERALALLTGHDLGRVDLVGPEGRVVARMESPRAAGRVRRHRDVTAGELFGVASLPVEGSAEHTDLAGWCAAGASPDRANPA